jgi:hypothetical protein
VRSWCAIAALGASALPLTWVVPAQADCNDATPRLLWSYPADGDQEVHGPVPLLVRTHGALLGARVGHETLAPQGMVAPTLDAISDSDAQLLPSNVPFLLAGELFVELELEGGAEPIVFGFTRPDPQVGVAPWDAQLTIEQHWVGGEIGRLSERCREILEGEGNGICYGNFPTAQMIGFDVRLAPEGDPAGEPGGEVIAYVVEGVRGGGEASRPRLWPAECGPPAVFTTLEIDDAEHCFRVMAYFEGGVTPVSSDEYCLGGGAPWPPAPAEPEADAGVPLADAGVPPTAPIIPPGTDCSGPCGCVNACDLIDPSGGMGVTQPTGFDDRGDGDGDAEGQGAGDDAPGSSSSSTGTPQAGKGSGGGCGVVGARPSRGWPMVGLAVLAWAALAAVRVRRRAAARVRRCRRHRQR